MERVTIYLRTALFTLPGDAGHVPVGTTVLIGDVPDPAASNLSVTTFRFLDERGRLLAEKSIQLLVPWSKIDHIQLG